MVTDPVPAPGVVVGVDGSADALAAVRWAARESRRIERPLHLVHASDDSPWPVVDPSHEQRSIDDVVRGALDAVRAVASVPMTTWSQPSGDPAAALVAASRSAAVVVLGCREASAARDAVWGSVAVAVAAEAQCPVVLVRAGMAELPPGAPVVAGVEEGPHADSVLNFAFEQALQRGVPLVAVHTWNPGAGVYAYGLPVLDVSQDGFAQAHRALARMLEMWQRRYPGVQVRHRTVRAATVDGLVRHSADACLLVVGSRSRHEVGGLLLGSISQAVMRHALCPVAVVHRVPVTTESTSPVTA